MLERRVEQLGRALDVAVGDRQLGQRERRPARAAEQSLLIRPSSGSLRGASRAAAGSPASAARLPRLSRIPIWPGASSVASNSASASPSIDRPRSRSPARAARTPRLPSVMPTPLRSPSSRRSASASSSQSRPSSCSPGRAGESAEAVQRERRAHRVAGVAEVGQALGQALARRLAEPLGARDVAERGEDVADRAPRVHAAKELHGLLEVHPRRPPRSSPATNRPTVWTRKKRS